MVFHVARTLNIPGIGSIALKLREDRAVGLSHDIGKEI